MFTAGHFPRDITRPRGGSSIIERSSLYSVFDEVVLLEYLTPETRQQLEMFNRRKEKLYNDTMQELHLEFRFIWLFDTREACTQVAERMTLQYPPDKHWWAHNFPFVLGRGDSDHVVWDGNTFCGWNSRYELCWGLIQRAYDFCMKYRGEKEWRAYEDGNDHWIRSSALFEEIKEAVAEVVDQEHAATITSDFTARMERLAEEADNLPLPSEDRPRLQKE